MEAPVSRAEQQAAQAAAQAPETKRLKRRIAIGRFSNETRYGRSFLHDENNDPLGKQVSDMLSRQLVESGRFLVFERPDMGRIENEQVILGESNLIGVDALILGSLTEFGRATTGQRGFLSGTKMQTAHATVEIRLVDPRTAHALFATSGSGEASTESGTVAGFGSKADYDATLNDKAIAAAISDLIGKLIDKLEERPWRTDILRAEGNRVFITGGERQGLEIGGELAVMRAGETVRSAQSGFDIQLPPARIATVRVSAFFGDSETNEGSVTEVVSGSVPSDTRGLFVAEIKGEERR